MLRHSQFEYPYMSNPLRDETYYQRRFFFRNFSRCKIKLEIKQKNRQQKAPVV
jgi:hypothetical protein